MNIARHALKTDWKIWLICLALLSLSNSWIELLPDFRMWQWWHSILLSLGHLFCGWGWIFPLEFYGHGFRSLDVYLVSFYLLFSWCVQHLIVSRRDSLIIAKNHATSPKQARADKYGAWIISGSVVAEAFIICRDHYLSGVKDVPLSVSRAVSEFLIAGVVLVLLIPILRQSRWPRKVVALILVVYPAMVVLGDLYWSLNEISIFHHQ
jgi:hypothetical protein